MPIDLDVSHFQDAVFWLLMLVFVLFFQDAGLCLLLHAFAIFRMLGCAYWFRCFSFSGCWAVPIDSDVSYFQDVGLCLLSQMFLI